jgi:hypothetical protein
MDIVTTVNDARHLLGLDVFCFDIETNTEAPVTGWGDKFGVSYATDPTWISFYASGYPVVTFDMAKDLPDYQEKVVFVRTLFNNTKGKTIIGHNVIFDLRLILGQYGIHLPLGAKVWDTLTMAIMLMTAPKVGSDLQLIEQLKKYYLVTKEELMFMESMKKKRGALHEVEAADVLKYVSLDAITTHRLYDFQQAIVRCSHDFKAEPYLDITDTVDWEAKVRYSDDKLSYVSHTKNWSNLPELIDWELRIARERANASGRGIKLNTEYVKQHRTELVISHTSALAEVLDVGKNWNEDKLNRIFTVVKYHAMLEKIVKGKRVPNSERWTYALDQVDVKDDLFWAVEGNLATQWYEYLCEYPNQEMPETYLMFDPVASLMKILYDKVPTPEQTEEDSFWRAKVAWNWYNHYFTQTKEIEPKKLVNKKLFQPFYLFCICEAPFPELEDIERMPELVTQKLKVLVEKSEEQMDFVRMAHSDGSWSTCEDAVYWYLEAVCKQDGIEYEDIRKVKHSCLTPFLEVSNTMSKLNRIDEFLRHASRDGRIHSIIARKTRTGRMTSVSMNLQNINMDDFRGYLVGDSEDYVVMGIDISNAENYFAALTFADDRLAYACASADLHEQMARAYWGDERIDHLMENDYKGFKRLRKQGKFVTFGSAYGAGAGKIARMVGCSKEEAKELLVSRNMRFPNYAQGKVDSAAKVDKLFAQGHRVPFTTLWTGRRVMVSLKTKTEGNRTVYEVPSYKAVNYLQQGGVGELIARAQVLVQEWLEEEAIDAHVPLQVHDEIIIHAHKDVAFMVAQKVSEIIASVVPEEYRNRTVPATRFISTLGPENAFKWGYNPLVDYPLPMDKYVNLWGTFDMPEGADEAPTMVCEPGRTIEDEIGERRQSNDDDGEDTAEQPTYVKTVSQWDDFDTKFRKMMEHIENVQKHMTPIKLVLGGEETGPYLFKERMVIQQELHHRGHDDNEYWDVWKDVQQLTAVARHLVSWYDEYQPYERKD